MSFWDNVKKFAQTYADDDYDDYDDEDDEIGLSDSTPRFKGVKVLYMSFVKRLTKNLHYVI